MHTCASPGCETLTFGEYCLGCMQRQARAEHAGRDDDRETASAEDAHAADARA